MALPFSKVLFFMVMHLHCLDNGAAIAILGQGRSLTFQQIPDGALIQLSMPETVRRLG
jgi:hypothetical protein